MESDTEAIIESKDESFDVSHIVDEKNIVRRVMLSIIPFLFVASFFCYLDRANVSFAILQMKEDLSFSSVWLSANLRQGSDVR